MAIWDYSDYEDDDLLEELERVEAERSGNWDEALDEQVREMESELNDRGIN